MHCSPLSRETDLSYLTFSLKVGMKKLHVAGLEAEPSLKIVTPVSVLSSILTVE